MKRCERTPAAAIPRRSAPKSCVASIVYLKNAFIVSACPAPLAATFGRFAGRAPAAFAAAAAAIAAASAAVLCGARKPSSEPRAAAGAGGCCCAAAGGTAPRRRRGDGGDGGRRAARRWWAATVLPSFAAPAVAPPLPLGALNGLFDRDTGKSWIQERRKDSPGRLAAAELAAAPASGAAAATAPGTPPKPAGARPAKRPKVAASGGGQALTMKAFFK